MRSAAFVAATLRAMEEIIAAPGGRPGGGHRRRPRPGLRTRDADCHPGRHHRARGLVACRRQKASAPSTPRAGSLSIAYMEELGFVPSPVTVDDLLDEGILRLTQD